MLFLLACTSTVQPAGGLAVLGISPSHGQIGVALDADVTVVDSQTLDPGTLGGVELLSGDTVLGATVSAEASVITLQPADALQPDTAYTVVLDPFIAGQDGSLLASQVRATFTTGSAWDTDADPEAQVEPALMNIRSSITVDDGLVAYSVDGAWTDPFVNITFFDEDPGEGCQWYGWVSDGGPVVFPSDVSVWSAYRVELDSFDTDCAGFDTDPWGADTPNTHLDNVSMAVGWGPMTPEAATRVQEDLEATGEDWAAYEPYVHSVWYAFENDSGTWDAYEVGYGIAHAVDADYELLEDGDGAPVWLEANGGDPGVAVYVGYHHQPLSTGILFR